MAAVPGFMLSDSSLLLRPKQVALQQAALHETFHISACQGLQTAHSGSCWWIKVFYLQLA